ncbi:MAG: hypothetical protein EHM45_05150 [Desulfobacteraceae bacterium]|nr:MAG: hypothetical protein EHM45_05150 [Desulfobacteraceae bacterium]
MSRQNIILQIYGYIICIITITTFLFGSYNLAESISDRSGLKIPSSTFASYENYKEDLMNNILEKFNCDEIKSNIKPYIPTDDEMIKMFENEKQIDLARDRHRNTKEIISKSVLVLLSIVIFLFHWKFTRKSSITTP